MRIVLLFLLGLFPAGAALASLGAMPLAELVRRAEVVVHATVISIERTMVEHDSRMASEKSLFSVASVQVASRRVLKGTPPRTLVVTAVENLEDSPRFRPNQEVVLFLTPNEDAVTYSTVGLMQGKYDVIDGVVVREQVGVGRFLAEIERLVERQANEQRDQPQRRP